MPWRKLFEGNLFSLYRFVAQILTDPDPSPCFVFLLIIRNIQSCYITESDMFLFTASRRRNAVITADSYLPYYTLSPTTIRPLTLRHSSSSALLPALLI